MGLTIEDLDKAIGLVYPQYLVLCKELGQQNRPQWLKMVAEGYFMVHYPESDRRDMKETEAYYVCHQALKDLRNIGQINCKEKQ